MNKALIIILALALIFIAACTPVSTPNTGRYNGGDEGLTVTFLEGEPPESVLDNNQEDFDLSVLVENVGEADIKPGAVIVTLNGIERDAFKLRSLTEKNTIEILGVKKLSDRIQDGESAEIRFQDANYQESLPFDFDVEVRADVCYDYVSTAVADVCLKSDASQRRTDDNCEIDNKAVDVDNSGAPVHITNFAQNARGSTAIGFTFDVVKVGSGDVFPPGNFKDKCTVDSDNDDTVKVTVDFLSRDNLGVDCTTLQGSTGLIRLTGGQKTVRCTVNTQSLQDIAFEKPLRITVDYMYKTSTETAFAVESTQDF